MTHVDVVGELVDQIVALRPTRTEEEQEFALVLYRLLANGEPVRREVLAAALDHPTRSIVATLATWPSLIEYNDHRAIVGFGGLSVLPTKHRLLVAERTLYTWCAWDSLFIPEILGVTARVESTSPGSDTPVTVTVGPNGVVDAHPETIVVSFPMPVLHDLKRDVRGMFCRFVHLFPTMEEGSEWAAQHDGIVLVSIQQAVEMGRRKNAAQFGDMTRHPVGGGHAA